MDDREDSFGFLSTDAPFPIPVDLGGTGADNVLDAQKNLGILSDANAESLWIIGAINSSSGGNSLSTTRIRTIGYLAKGIKEIDVASGYRYMLFAYSNGAYLGTWNGSTFVQSGNWITDATKLTELPDYDYRVVLADVNDGSITTASAPNLTLLAKTDTTLSISGMAADAKTTGDSLSQLRDKYTVSRVYETFTANAMTFERVNDSTVKMYGTNNSSGSRSYNFLNEEHVTLYTSTEAPKTFPAGRYEVQFEFTGANPTGANLLFVKTTTAAGSNMQSGQIIESDAPWTIAIRCAGSANFGTESNPTYLNIQVYALPVLESPTMLHPTGDSTDRTNDIRSTLLSFGCCVLEAGEYYVENLQMPGWTMLEGGGKGTVIRIPNNSTGSALKLARGCTVRELKIVGPGGESYDAMSGSVVGTSHGISVDGSHVGVISGDDMTNRLRIVIDSVQISGFTGAGIYLYNTGGNIGNTVAVSDCNVHNCNAGIYTKLSEYHRIVNSSFNGCYYGAYNDGGNNLFSNCSFGGCAIGAYLENLDGSAGNNSHGTFSSCNFNHEHDISVKIDGGESTANYVASGEVFVGCHFGYGRVEISNAVGINFTACNFLSRSPVIVGGGGMVLFNGCIFISSTETPVTKTGTGTLLFRECYLRNGTAFNPI